MDTKIAALSEIKWQMYLTMEISSFVNVSFKSFKASTVFTSFPARLSLRYFVFFLIRINYHYFNISAILINEGNVTSSKSSVFQ